MNHAPPAGFQDYLQGAMAKKLKDVARDVDQMPDLAKVCNQSRMAVRWHHLRKDSQSSLNVFRQNV